MKKKAFITGINGQDGSYLAEYLVSLGYEVHGTIRRNSTSENQDERIIHLDKYIHTYYADLLDQSSLEKILREVILKSIKVLHHLIFLILEITNP